MTKRDHLQTMLSMSNEKTEIRMRYWCKDMKQWYYLEVEAVEVNVLENRMVVEFVTER